MRWLQCLNKHHEDVLSVAVVVVKFYSIAAVAAEFSPVLVECDWKWDLGSCLMPE